MQRFTQHCLALCCSLLLIFLAQSNALASQNTQDTQHLSTTLEWLEDKERVLSVEDVIFHSEQHLWTKADTPSAEIGAVDSTYWLTTQITISHPSSNWILSIIHSGINQVDYWIADNTQSIIQQGTFGADYPFGQRPLSLANFSIPLQLESDQQYQLIFRVRMDGFLDFPLILETASLKLEAEVDRSFSLGLYYGIAIIMVLYNLTIYLFVKPLTYSILLLSRLPPHSLRP